MENLFRKTIDDCAQNALSEIDPRNRCALWCRIDGVFRLIRVWHDFCELPIKRNKFDQLQKQL
jgi:hypothetical protein